MPTKIHDVDVVLLSSVFHQVKIAEPLGACVLAASLRAGGITVKILEPSVRGWNIPETVAEVSKWRSSVVGISMHRDKHVIDVLEFVAALRQLCPWTHIIIGGHGPSVALQSITPEQAARIWTSFSTIMAEGTFARGKNGRFIPRDADGTHVAVDTSLARSILAQLPRSPYYDRSLEYLLILQFADAYLLGEADVSFPHLVERVLRDEPWLDTPGLAYLDAQNRLVRNPASPKITNLDAVPHMARDVLEEYQSIYALNTRASILASRGCSYRCTFCSVVKFESLQNGIHHRFRSNEDLIAEMLEVNRAYGVTHFDFEDDNFLVPSPAGRERLRNFCTLLGQLPLPITFTLFCRPDAVTQELFSMLHCAGLVGIYLGIESANESDLEFFHKGMSLGHVYRAMETLQHLGFSAGVGSRLRIMLGYITWHPRSSFESLRASSRFIRRFGAPPKLLRRKLRLYSGTEAIDRVHGMGLLNPSAKDGWDFLDPRITGLDEFVNDFFGMVNRLRDRLRTLEKAHSEFEYPVDTLERIRSWRLQTDAMLFDYFDHIIELAAAERDGAAAPSIGDFDSIRRAAFENYVQENGIRARIDELYKACELPSMAVDLFRK